MSGNSLPRWAADYIGIEFNCNGRTREQGLDCYGLLRLVYLEQASITLESFDEIYSAIGDHAGIMAASATRKTHWLKVNDTINPMDLLVFNIRGFPVHVGLALNKKMMLHTQKGHASVIENYTCHKWRNRLEGAYRWPTLS